MHFTIRYMKVNTEEEVSKGNSTNGKLNITKQSKESLAQYFLTRIVKNLPQG